ncbi:hypothetical protein MJ_0540 [Methanocaldococcus jannaschii DSM 2661]|uniref:Uncharacterized protein MJ0540 n=1 Tax=Methanocaldococcus jannaschii (strain ATCC 43067 / DSM 2661 / JAL-1 / JCM 10045 / NBRC 100440) TaxID=243232 RepID=Y540_METJA|nr:DUF2097 domain-containing protein [Methanocaldococcus jannaschii]Q57960.1 RecName: Full=Uncharacterized protein MJ0540 [Methanocaldococcus jannaschii DSM 2661]AAB98537.1 hypothetical protein MJ_0540 [Methanocaldococcus jannaschii DSM 2661]
MEEIIDVKNPKEVIEYLNNIDVDEYVEIYFGRVHVEGRLMHYNDGLIRLVHEKYGIIEVEIEKILDDLLELVHSNGEKRVVLRFY